MQPLDVRRVDIARAAARLEDEERIGVEGDRVEVVWELRCDLRHRVGVSLILFLALVGDKILDVADRERIDERALLRRRLVAQADRLLRRGIGERRLIGGHRPVQVRAPRPAFAPIADRAVGIALPRFAEGTDRVDRAKAYSIWKPWSKKACASLFFDEIGR
jgi:hypothetical protein